MSDKEQDLKYSINVKMMKINASFCVFPPHHRYFIYKNSGDTSWNESEHEKRIEKIKYIWYSRLLFLWRMRTLLEIRTIQWWLLAVHDPTFAIIKIYIKFGVTICFIRVNTDSNRILLYFFFDYTNMWFVLVCVRIITKKAIKTKYITIQ